MEEMSKGKKVYDEPLRPPFEILSAHTEMTKERLMQLGDNPDWIVRRVTEWDMEIQLGDFEGTITDAPRSFEIAKAEFASLQKRYDISIAPHKLYLMRDEGGADADQVIVVVTKKIRGEEAPPGHDYFSEEHAPALQELYEKLYRYYEDKFEEAVRNPNSAVLWDVSNATQYLSVRNGDTEELVLVDVDPYVCNARAQLAPILEGCVNYIKVMVDEYKNTGHLLQGVEEKFRALEEKVDAKFGKK